MEHAIPTTAELAEAVREFLDEDVRPATTVRVHFLARVAANVLAIVERELRLGPAAEADHARRLAALGLADDLELAGRIRAGALDDRLEEVVDLTRRHAVDRLRIANPSWLCGADAATPPRETEREP